MIERMEFEFEKEFSRDGQIDELKEIFTGST